MTIGDMVEIGAYDLHSRFSRVANFVGGGRLVALGTQALGDGPLNIVIHALPDGLTGLDVGLDTLVLRGREVRSWNRGVGTAYDSGITDYEPGDSTVRRIKENGAAVRDFLCRSGRASSLRFLWMNETPGFGGGSFDDAVARRIRAGARALRAGRWIEGARSLRGVGMGLTPAGDDFLAGVMFGLHVAARATGADARPVVELIGDEALGGEPIRREPIIQAMYRMARRARAFRSLKNLLAAIVRDGEEAVVSCAQSVFSIGATSGTDLVAGLAWAIEKGGCGWRL